MHGRDYLTSERNGSIFFLFKKVSVLIVVRTTRCKQKENHDKNKPETRDVKDMVDQEYQLQLWFGLLGGLIRCVKNLVLVGWSVGIQLT